MNAGRRGFLKTFLAFPVICRGDAEQRFAVVDANGVAYLIKPEALERTERLPMNTNVLSVSGRIK